MAQVVRFENQVALELGAPKAGTEGGHWRESILQVNNIYGINRTVLSGAGISAQPNYFQEANWRFNKVNSCDQLATLFNFMRFKK